MVVAVVVGEIDEKHGTVLAQEEDEEAVVVVVVAVVVANVVRS